MSPRFQRKWSVGTKHLSFPAGLGTKVILALFWWNSVNIGFNMKLSTMSRCFNWQLKHVKQFKHAAGFFTALVCGFSRNNVELRVNLPSSFLRRYSEMASRAKCTGRNLFVLQPKIHCLHHFAVSLFSAYKRNVVEMNPLGKSCQPSEDFIGRPARLARRVTAQRPVLASYHG